MKRVSRQQRCSAAAHWSVKSLAGTLVAERLWATEHAVLLLASVAKSEEGRGGRVSETSEDVDITSSGNNRDDGNLDLRFADLLLGQSVLV